MNGTKTHYSKAGETPAHTHNHTRAITMPEFNFNPTSDIATSALARKPVSGGRFNVHTTSDQAAADLASGITNKTGKLPLAAK